MRLIPEERGAIQKQSGWQAAEEFYRFYLGRDDAGKVVELSEETFPWLKPLIDHDFTRDYFGRDSRASFALSDRFAKMHLESMPLFYAEIVASLIRRAAILFDVTVLKREGKI